MKQMCDEPTIPRIPPVCGLIRLAEGRVVEPGSRIKLTVEENPKPENPTASRSLKRVIDRQRTQVRRQQLKGCGLAHARVHR
jgi:hypothetical protein